MKRFNSSRRERRVRRDFFARAHLRFRDFTDGNKQKFPPLRSLRSLREIKFLSASSARGKNNMWESLT